MDTFYKIFSVGDIIILPFLLLTYFFIVRNLLLKYLKDDFNRFEQGLLIWIIGNLAYICIFIFHYKWGDTFNYYQGACRIVDSIVYAPNEIFQLYFASNIGEVKEASIIFSKIENVDILHHSSNYFVVKLISFFLFITFKSYLATSLVLTFVSYYSCYSIILQVCKKYYTMKNYFFYCIFFIPGLLIFGGGITKESFCFLGLALVFNSFFKLIPESNRGYELLKFIFGCYLLLSVKNYIAIIYFIAIGTHILLFSKKYIHKLLFFCLAIIFVLSGFLTELIFRYNSETIFEALQAQGNNIYELSELEGGSSYSLKEYEPNLLGLFSVFTESISVAVFRPYLWELNKITNVLSSLEGIYNFLFMSYLLFRFGIKNVLIVIFKNPLTQFCLIYAILFLFVVGITSYNFGALARYRLPGEFFLLISFCTIFHDLKLKDEKKKHFIFDY